jgi:ABC-type uncharacterized transport system auxiliary subunit
MSHESLFLENVLQRYRPWVSVSVGISRSLLMRPQKLDSEIQMNAKAGNNHRSAVLVEARIVYEGEQGGEIEAALHVGRIVGFDYALTSILQAFLIRPTVSGNGLKTLGLK